ncbi:hypothetical protein [Haloplanus salinus]|nr:hypothetical protein [Haloplanus salinus]
MTVPTHAGADLLPEIRTEESNSLLQLAIILGGIGIMYGITFLKPLLS